MKNRDNRLTNFTSGSLRLFGVALVLTSFLIRFAPPGEIMIFLTPYTGSKVLLANALVVIGVVSTAVGYVVKRMLIKVNS